MAGENMTHHLTETEYEYRGHYIARAGDGWHVYEDRHGDSGELFIGSSVDDCTAAIDEVVDDGCWDDMPIVR